MDNNKSYKLIIVMIYYYDYYYCMSAWTWVGEYQQ